MQLLAGMAIALSMSANAMATDYKAGPIEIMNPKADIVYCSANVCF
jgi:hypothetical protein